MEIINAAFADVAALRRERSLLIPDKADGYFRDRIRTARPAVIRHEDKPIGYVALEQHGDGPSILELYVREGHRRMLRPAFEAVRAQVKPVRMSVRTDDPLLNLLCHDLGLTPRPGALYLERESYVRLPVREGWEIVPVTEATFEAAYAILNAEENPMQGRHSEEDRAPMQASIGTRRYNTLLINGEVAAVGMLHPLPDDEGTLDIGMVVARPWRQQGLATWLIANLASEMEEQGFRIVAGMGDFNKPSRATLTKAGFRVVYAWQSVALG